MFRKLSKQNLALFCLVLWAAFYISCAHHEIPPSKEPIVEKQSEVYEAPGTINYRPEVIQAVSKALAERGLYDLKVKPAYGSAMQEALGRFQREEGIPVTRKIDEATLKKLKLEIDPEKILLTNHELRALTKPPESLPRVSIDYSTKGTYEAPKEGGIAWEQVIQIEGASAARLYFRELQLGEGHSLEIKNADNKLVAHYRESKKEGFWTEFLSPLPLTVQIVAPRGGTGGGVTIDRAQIRLKQEGTERNEGDESHIGTNDLVSIGSFPTGSEIYQRGSAVAILLDQSGNSYCTGFLIGPNRLITCNHCIATMNECTTSVARFNFQNDSNGNPLVTTDYNCVNFLQTDYDLDYSVVELEGFPGHQWGYLHPVWDNVYEPEELTIIGHPSGRPKEVSRTNCWVTDVVIDGRGTATDISYCCDTEPGSSGSPVYDLRHYDVIALHHWGVTAGHPNNQGVRMRRILADCHVCAQPFASPGRSFDIDKDGKEDAYVRSPDWAGVVRSTATGFETSWIKGDWVGQWNLGVDNWEYTADVDGDGDGDIIIRSPEWLGIFKGSSSGLTFQWLIHDWIGNWNLGFDDDSRVGDFNNDGKDDLLVRSDEWIGILLSDGNKLTTTWMAHDWLGGWNLGRPDRFWIGDFTGDGKDDVFVRSPEWAGLFKSHGDCLEQTWIVHDWLGPWNMGDGDEHYVGDFNADGKDDILTRSNRWVSLWISTGSGFNVPWIQYDWVGSWHLGWQDWHHVADFNDDGKDDVLIRSNEWIGLLISNGTSLSNPWIRFDWLGQWNLGLPDRERVGDYNGDGKADVMIRSPEWIGRFLSTGTSLTNDFIKHDWLGSWNLGEVDRLVGGR